MSAMSHPIFAGHRPIIAILRGITSSEAEAAVDALVGAGIGLIEVPLNSPDPFASISLMAAKAGSRAIIGAGTVLAVDEVERVKTAGGSIVVSPNTDVAVIRASKSAGLTSMPGVFTATEALTAVSAGADALKFFPADVLGPLGIKGISVVLPHEVPLLAVGGVDEENLTAYLAAGVAGFGIGSSIYRPGMAASDIAGRACRIIAAFDRAAAG
jgi:2-dehydro-3-deoxyphosphogalactonate aldolase